MDADYGSDYITIEDENGVEFELEHILSLEHKGKEYALFLPADMDEEDPEYGYIILEVIEENGEELFNSLDDDEQLVEIYNLFMDQLFEEDDEKGE